MFGLKFEPHHPDPNMNEYIKSAFYLVPVACLSLLHGWGRESKGLHGAGWAARGFMLLIFSGFVFSVYYVRKEAVPLQNYLLSTAVAWHCAGVVLRAVFSRQENVADKRGILKSFGLHRADGKAT